MIISSLVVTTSAYAQETTPGPGKVEVTLIPGGMTFFTKKTTSAEPSFGNYDIGAAFAGNFNRIVGVEGELGGSLGITQTLSGLTTKEKTPNMLAYSGNLVVNAPGHSLVPYATGGIGGLTLYNRAVLGISNGANSFLTSNVGGGLKWFAGNGRWGLRGDYRFETVKSKTTATSFFGQSTRYANRIYGAVIINAVK
jgi:hypothetical protein